MVLVTSNSSIFGSVLRQRPTDATVYSDYNCDKKQWRWLVNNNTNASVVGKLEEHCVIVQDKNKYLTKIKVVETENNKRNW